MSRSGFLFKQPFLLHVSPVYGSSCERNDLSGISKIRCPQMKGS